MQKQLSVGSEKQIRSVFREKLRIGTRRSRCKVGDKLWARKGVFRGGYLEMSRIQPSEHATSLVGQLHQPVNRKAGADSKKT